MPSYLTYPRSKKTASALHNLGQMLEMIRPPEESDSSLEHVEHLSLLVQSEEDLKSTLDKVGRDLDRRDLFVQIPDSRMVYSGDPSEVVELKLETLEVAEDCVKNFLYKKCRWPPIFEFSPST